MSIPDVIVVGAGIVGAAIARELSMAARPPRAWATSW